MIERRVQSSFIDGAIDETDCTYTPSPLLSKIFANTEKLKMQMHRSIAVLLLAATLFVAPVYGKTFRWTSQGDPLTMDPHAQNEGLTISIMNQIYEALIRRDKDWKLAPELAISWSNVSPSLWRFNLRPGVKFHDGKP